MGPPLKKMVGAALASLFFVQNVCLLHAVENSLWTERKANKGHQPKTAKPALLAQAVVSKNLANDLPLGPMRSLALDRLKNSPVGTPPSPSSLMEITNIAAPHAALRESFISSNPKAPLIVHIQDVHGHEEAQRNVAALLENLSNKNHIRFIGLEGAEGRFILEPYRSYPNKRATAFLAAALLKLGYLSGPEAAALSMAQTPLLWGLERFNLYQENVEAVVRSKAMQRTNESFFAEASDFLARAKQTIYPASMLLLDKRLEAYEQGELDLSEYVRGLMSELKKQDGSPSDFNEFALFLSAVDQEKKIAFDRAQGERGALVAALAGKLPEDALAGLVQKSAAVRAGALGLGDFYRLIQELCDRSGVPLSRFPHFQAYVNYLFVCERIQRVNLLGELARLEEKVFQAGLRSEPERMLAQLSKDYHLLRKLSRHGMTADEWAAASARLKEIHQWSKRARQLVRMIHKSSFPNVSIGNPESSTDGKSLDPRFRGDDDKIPVLSISALAPDEDFCSLALARNQALIDNLLTQMKTAGEKRAVLVAGGFHTAGLTALLRKKNISFVVLTPKITRVSGGGSDYLDVFYRDPTPLEKTFAGERIFLASEPLLSENAGQSPLPSTVSRAKTLQGLFATAEPALAPAMGNSAWNEVSPLLEKLAQQFPSIDKLSLSLKATSPSRTEISARLIEKDGARVPLRLILTTKEKADVAQKQNPRKKLLTELDGDDDRALLVYRDDSVLIGWINPAWETIFVGALVVLARALLGQPLLSPSDFSFANVGAVALIAVLLTAGHALMKKDRRVASLIQWFVGFSLFAGAFMFLSWPAALLTNIVVHFPWNRIYLLARAEGWRLADVMVPFSLTPDESPEEIDRKLNKALASPSALIFTENADALDAALRRKVAGRPYLRLTLQNQSDLMRLSKIIRIDEDGTTHVDEEGPLIKIIKGGGVLFIDYSNSNPKIVGEFYSLFDSPSYYRSHLSHPDLKIIGAINKANESQQDVSFYRRFGTEIEIGEIPFQDPLSRIEAADHVEGAVEEVELFEAPEFLQKLVSHTTVRDKVEIVKGALIRAIEEHKPLVIRGAVWDNSRLAYFFRQAFLQGVVEFNGEPITIPPDLKIFSIKTDYSQNVANKRIATAAESTLTGDVWVINRETMGILFSRTEVLENPSEQGKRTGKFFEHPGLLSEKTLRLRIADVLPDWAWHQIMHAYGEIEIEALPGVPVPSIYREHQTPASKQAFEKASYKTWEQAKREKAIVVESDDLAFVRARVKEEFGEEPVVHRVTPDTTLDQLLATIELETTEGRFGFASEPQRILKALEEGHVVILNGVDANETLARQLETVIQEKPYLFVNNRRIDLKGKLILTSPSSLPALSNAATRVKLQPTDEDLRKIIADEFGDKFDGEEFDRIMKLRKMIVGLPSAEVRHHNLSELEKSHPSWLRPFSHLTMDQRRRLYPPQPSLGLSRLRLLYKSDSLLEGVEDVFISPYKDDPEVAAYLRTMARLTLKKEEKGRQPHSIAGRKLFRVLNQTMDGEQWPNYFWQLADTLSLDLLEKLSLTANLSQTRPYDLENVIGPALVTDQGDERKGFFRDHFHVDRENPNPPAIDMETRIGEPTFQDMKEKAMRLLKNGIPVMFMGSPGTGKSFLASEIRKEPEFEGSQPPITVGSDTKEHDLWRRRVEKENRRTEWEDQAVAQWAGKTGPSLLVIDEANLTDRALLSLLEDHPGPEKAVICTGNQRTLTGRNDIDFIRDHAVTLRFEEFDQDFLRDKIANVYLSHTKQNHEKLVDDLLWLHSLFEKMAEDKGLSLRDVQELVARINVRTGPDWTVDQVVGVAWRQYRGLFDMNDRDALRFIIADKFGVDVKDLEKKEIGDISNQWSDAFWRTDEVVLTASAAKMVSSIQDCLLMRDDRIEGRGRLDGKRGVIIEGPSGRGKDLPLIATLKNRGFFDAKSAPPGTPKNRIYYHLNASLTNHDTMIDVIKQAQRKGSVVIISEMNYLPTSFLEGKLNDVLAEKPKTEGFFLFATINSTDFSGRARLSTALQNRVIYLQEPDYTEQELTEIGRTIADKKGYRLSKKELLYLVKAHLWIRSRIKNPALHPTTPHLIKALEIYHQTRSMEGAINEVYGLLFLKRFLNDAALPSAKELYRFKPEKPVNNLKMIPRIYAGLMPPGTPPLVIHTDIVDRNGGYHMPGKGISLSPEEWAGDGWAETFKHETSHGMFTRDIPGLTPGHEDLNQLYQDLEDLRHLNSFDRHFPAARMSRPRSSEQRFARMILTNDAKEFANEFSQWSQQPKENLTPRKMFQYALLVYAKELLGKNEELARAILEAKAKVLDAINSDFNPLRAALRHLQRAKEYGACIPKNLGEVEIFFQQYRALKKLREMEADFIRLPKDFPKPKKKIELAEQEQAAAKVAAQVQKRELAPPLLKEEDREPTIEGEAAPLSEKEIRKMQKALRAKRLYLPQFGLTKNRLWATLRAALVVTIVGGTVVLLGGTVVLLVMQFLPHDLLSNIFSSSSANWIGLAVGIVIMIIVWKLRHTRLFQRIDDWIFSWLERWMPAGLKKRLMTEEDAVHSEQEPGDANPIPLVQPEREPVLEPLAAKGPTQPGRWDSRMQALSTTHRSELDRVLEDFVKHELQPDKDHGPPPGLPDFEHFLRVDKINFYRRPLAVHKRTKKEIVVTGEIDLKNPILNEFLRYLAKNDFEVRVTNETLTDDDKAKLSRGKAVEFIDAKELQEKVEAIYLYGAYRTALEERKTAATSPAPAAPAEAQPDLPAEKQKEIIRELLKKLDLPDERFNEKEWSLDLSISKHLLRVDVSNLTDLALLTSLKRLDLSFCTGVDLNVVSSLRNLEYLTLQRTNVSDLKPLASLKKLTHLVLGENPIEDITPLQNLPLVSLSLYNCPRIKNFETLRHLSGLKRLFLPQTRISELSALEGKKKLTTLDLMYTEVTDLSPLRGIPLRELKIKIPPLTLDDVFPLFEAHPAPETLEVRTSAGPDYIRYADYLEWEKTHGGAAPFDVRPGELSAEEQRAIINELNQRFGADAPVHESEWVLTIEKSVGQFDLYMLKSLTLLKNLAIHNLPENTDIAPLASLRNLERLVLGSTGVRDIGPLRNLRKLRTLFLERSFVTDISPLADLPIEDLMLRKCYELKNFEPLRRMPHLRVLDMKYLHLKDLQFLAGMTQLESLNVSDNELSSLAPLHGLPIKELEVARMEGTLHEEEVYKLFDHHPAPEALAVVVKDIARPITYQDYLRHRASMTAAESKSLSFDQQIEAASAFLYANEVDRTGRYRYSTGSFDRIRIFRHQNEFYFDLQETTLPNGIEKLKPLDGLDGINLSRSNVTDIAPLIRQPRLRVLHLEETPVTDFGPLQFCRKLEYLYLNHTAFKDHRLLYDLPLIKLDLSGTSVDESQIQDLLERSVNPNLEITKDGVTHTRASFSLQSGEVSSLSEREKETGEFLRTLYWSLMNQDFTQIVALARLKREGLYTPEIREYVGRIITGSVKKNIDALGIFVTGFLVGAGMLIFGIIAVGHAPEEFRLAGALLLSVAPLYIAGLFLLAWFARSLGKRAGPPALVLPHKGGGTFLDHATPDPSVFFFSVDPVTKTLFVNPAVKAGLSRLPRWFQNLLLHGFGVIGHELLHIKGWGEFAAFAVAQVLPAVMGSLTFGIIALLIGLPTVAVALAGLFGVFVVTAMVSWGLEKKIPLTPHLNPPPQGGRKYLAQSLATLFPDARSAQIEMRVDPKALARQRPTANAPSEQEFLESVSVLAIRHHSEDRERQWSAAGEPARHTAELQKLFDQLGGEPEEMARERIRKGVERYNTKRRALAKRESSFVTFNRSLEQGRPVVMDLSSLLQNPIGSQANEIVVSHLKNLREALALNPNSKSQVLLLANGFDGAPEQARAVVEAFLKDASVQGGVLPTLVKEDSRIFQGGKIWINGIRRVFFNGDPSAAFSLYATSENVFADLTAEQSRALLLLMMPGGVARVSTIIEQEIDRKVFLSVQA